jgi:hypothetical protein
MAAADLPKIREFWAKVDAWRDGEAVRRSRRQAEVLQSQGFGLNRRKVRDDSGNLQWEHRSNYERKLATWTKKSAQYMRNVKGSFNSKDFVLMTSSQAAEAQRILADGLADVDEGVASAFDSVLGAHALKMLEMWPIDSGLSKAALGMTTEFSENGMRVTVASSAPYVIFIREAYTFNAKGERTGGGERLAGVSKAYRIKFKSGKWILPPWKARYLVQGADGRWSFDGAAYEADKFATEKRREAQIMKGGKATKGRPFHDYLGVKPSKRLAEETAKLAVENIVKES